MDSHFGKSEKRIMMITTLVMLHLKLDLTINLETVTFMDLRISAQSHSK